MSADVLALPSKGRLMDDAAALLARAGYTVTRDDPRGYRGSLAAGGIEVAFLSATEIAQQIADGRALLGITGEDLVREVRPDWRAHFRLIAPLGFGHANVVVAVPECWLDVCSMADLEEAAAAFRRDIGRPFRVATKYAQLTTQHFRAHSVTSYRIVESLGATEGAPAAGSAELIVDITSSGETLRANGLRVLQDGLILASQAQLVAGCVSLPPALEDLARAITHHASSPPSTANTAPVI